MSASEEQSSVARHRSSKPSGAVSDQDQLQHDPDHPYYSEISLSDVSTQYAEENPMIVLEVKLMALSRGLRLHQYLDDWLIRSQ